MMRIVVVGVGGGGGKAVDRLLDDRLPQHVDYVVVDSDSDDLRLLRTDRKILIGHRKRRGLGTGGQPDLGREAAAESEPDLVRLVADADLVFVVCGLGGGTGTGAAPIIAKHATRAGAVTIGVVTKPFLFEGRLRVRRGIAGLAELSESCDAVIAIPAESLLRGPSRTDAVSFSDALRLLDAAAARAVNAVIIAITSHGETGEPADVSQLLTDGRVAGIGTGLATGANRATEAVERAFRSELLSGHALQHTAGVLVALEGPPSIPLEDQRAVLEQVQRQLPRDAEIVFGTDYSLKSDAIRVTLVLIGTKLPKPDAADSEFTFHDAGGLNALWPSLADRDAPNASSFVIAWDPAVVDPELYAEVVQILGDLSRVAGAQGVTRIRGQGLEVHAPEGAYA